jgi:hypothetical protein
MIYRSQIHSLAVGPENRGTKKSIPQLTAAQQQETGTAISSTLLAASKAKQPFEKRI